MKKILLLFLCCICLCGCKEKKELSFSELTIKHTILGYNTVSGTIQNNTNKTINNVKIILTLKSGDLKQECSFNIINKIPIDGTQVLDEEIIHCDGINLDKQPNFENYKIIDKKIDYIYYND